MWERIIMCIRRRFCNLTNTYCSAFGSQRMLLKFKHQQFKHQQFELLIFKKCQCLNVQCLNVQTLAAFILRQPKLRGHCQWLHMILCWEGIIVPLDRRPGKLKSTSPGHYRLPYFVLTGRWCRRGQCRRGTSCFCFSCLHGLSSTPVVFYTGRLPLMLWRYLCRRGRCRRGTSCKTSSTPAPSSTLARPG